MSLECGSDNKGCFTWTIQSPPLNISFDLQSPVFSLWNSEWQLTFTTYPVRKYRLGLVDNIWEISLTQLSSSEEFTQCVVTANAAEKSGKLVRLDTRPLIFMAKDTKLLFSCYKSTILQMAPDVEVDKPMFVITFEDSWRFYETSRSAPQMARNEEADNLTLGYQFENQILQRFQKISISVNKGVQTPSSLCNSSCLESLSADLRKLIDKGTHHDLELQCGDQIIPVHGTILCTRSEVFASMLQDYMKGKRTGPVEIQDLEFSILQQFLLYLYSGTLPELTVEGASRLYEVGDKYAVVSLKKRCSGFLQENLTLQNACELLVFADTYNDQEFKESVISFIVDQEVPKKESSWSAFCSTHPMLGLEVLNRCMFIS